MAQTDLGKWMITNGGDYNPETTYEQLTIVLYNNSMFLTLKTVKGITPVNDNINYSLMAQGAATTLLSAINATDTYGALGEVGATVSSQALVDYLADSVMNKLIEKTQIANNLTTQDSDKVLSALQGYNLKQSVDELNSNLFPNKGKIPDGTDFNSLLTVGKYLVASNDKAQTMTNIPEQVAGRLFVLNMLGDEKVLNREYQYFIQIYLLYTSTLWMRTLRRENDGSPIIFDNWVKRW